MSLYIDLTEFLIHPIRTGIQRIEGEMCRYLPQDAAVPLRLHAGRYLALSPALIGAIGKHFRDASPSGAAEIDRLGAPESGIPVEISDTDTLLVPEVFAHERVDFFGSMPDSQFERCRFIVYDLLPFTHPEFFPPDFLAVLAGYFHVIRRAHHCGFISEYTRDVYYQRLKRAEPIDGVVLPLGCDSLGHRPARPILDRPLVFTVVGTIEPRKNHALILEAFEPFLGQIPGLTLSFVGKMGWVSPEFGEKVLALAADKKSGFQFHSAPGDEAIRHHIEQSRATISISVAEGYGLPPVESLWLGTPIIASATIPSLQRLGSAGIHYVEPLTVENLRRAVVAFVDTAYANQKIEETKQLNLPTWQFFTQEVLRWCEG